MDKFTSIPRTYHARIGTVSLDQQYFNNIRENALFYIDRAAFIRVRRNTRDSVTLITRARLSGKTLMMSTAEQFLSMKYAGRADLCGVPAVQKTSLLRQWL